MASCFLLIALFPVLCGVAVLGNQYYYPGCRNSVKAVPSMGENCSAILCSQRYRPVCGSDGEEYLHDCLLCKAACSNKELYKACDGFCPCRRSVDGEDSTRKRKPVPALEPTLGPGIVLGGFCFGEGACP